MSAAKHLSKMNLPNVTITLISDKSWIEYYGALYRLIRGSSPAEVMLPLELTVDTKRVTLIIDSIQHIDSIKKNVEGTTKTYAYDTLILSPGSVSNYFGIPGMDEHSVTMKSVADTLELKQSVIDHVTAMSKTTDQIERQKLGRFAIVGAGPTGIEIAGEILPLARTTAKKVGIDPSLIEVCILEAMDRLLPAIEPKASAKVLKRLNHIGVNLMLNTAVASIKKNAVTLKDGSTLDVAMIIWTAGVKPNPLLATIKGIEADKRGRAIVDEHLQAKNVSDIYVLGDCASTPFSGMAQTAFDDGAFIAQVIAANLRASTVPTYAPKAPAYAIPARRGWAAVKYGPIRAYGFPGYILRRLADIHVYMLVLPWRYIPSAYFGRLPVMKAKAQRSV